MALRMNEINKFKIILEDNTSSLTIKIIYKSCHIQKMYTDISEMFCNKYNLKSPGIKEKRSILFDKGKLKDLTIEIPNYKSLIAIYNNLLNGLTYSSTDEEAINLFRKSSVDIVERLMKEHIENLDGILYRFCLEERIDSFYELD